MKKLIAIFSAFLLVFLIHGLASAIPPDGTGGWTDDGSTTSTDRDVVIDGSLRLGQYTVATLPSTLGAGDAGFRAEVTDGDSATDCTTGGGSDIVTCRWTGSAWANAGDGVAAGGAEVQDEAFTDGNFNGDTSHGVSQDDFWDLWATLVMESEVLNEDDMATESNTYPPTQDSVVKYIAAQLASYLTSLAGELGGDLDQNGKLIYEDAETAFTDSDAPAPDLDGAAQIIKFTDDGGTDEDTITGFSNIQTGAVYHATFVDAYWKIDFSGTNLKGHGGNDWTPRAGDSMTFWTTDGTTINCIVSAPTQLSVSTYYEMPLQTTTAMEAGSDHSASGFVDTVTVDSGASSTYSICLHEAADGEYEVADKDATTTLPCTVLAIEDGTGSKKVLTYGKWRDDTANWTTGPGMAAMIYLGDDGALTQTAPSTTGDYVQFVGRALTDDVMFFNPNYIPIEVP
jgi:hypothetical protein